MDGYAFYDALLHSMQVNFDFWDNISEKKVLQRQ